MHFSSHKGLNTPRYNQRAKDFSIQSNQSNPTPLSSQHNNLCQLYPSPIWSLKINTSHKKKKKKISSMTYFAKHKKTCEIYFFFFVFSFNSRTHQKIKNKIYFLKGKYKSITGISFNLWPLPTAPYQKIHNPKTHA